MKVLVINTGSSSIKFQCFEMTSHEVLVKGIVEKIGEEVGRIIYKKKDSPDVVVEKYFENHKFAMEEIVSFLVDDKKGIVKNIDEIEAVGHRTVHGGESFCESVLITEEVLSVMKEMIPLAPLHNPANITGIEVASEIFKNAKHVGVFDTAFHQTMPAKAFRYAIPDELYTKSKIRRYGFHGTSHYYVAKITADFLNIPFDKFTAITIHIGNGASIAAIKNGLSIDTSMGMTPLEGLMMGTRCGDLDPAIPQYLVNHDKMSINQVNMVLNKKSGLKGITGKNDIREIQNGYLEGDKQSVLAIDMYAYRIKKYIGAYLAILGEIDSIIFTAGVGENSSLVRSLALDGLEKLNIVLDKKKNMEKGKNIREIQKGDSYKIVIAPTDEELEIANQTVAVIKRS